MALVEVKVPDIGDFKDVEVIELLVKPGDNVALDQSLLTVESDKASMEIPSAAAGVVQQLLVKLGDKVSQGSVVLMLDAAGGAAAAPPPAQAAAVAALTDEAEAHLCRTIALLRDSAARLWTWCDERDIERVPSDTHYGLIRASARDIMVRDCTSFGLPGWIRVAVRTEPENAILRRGIIYG